MTGVAVAKVFLEKAAAVKIAMIGTRGVPARYGGFETAVEEVGARLVARGHDVTVYCRNRGQLTRAHRGMQLVNLPAIRTRSLETLSHSALSAAHSLLIRRPDVAVLFNAANAPLIPALRAAKVPMAIHTDGLESLRAKWTGLGAAYYRHAEGYAAKSGCPLIADAAAIADYLRETYGRTSYFIPYGTAILHPKADRLSCYGVASRGYHLVVARLEPENNVKTIVEGYRRSHAEYPLLVVGTAPYQGEYIDHLHRLAQGANIRFLGGIWDQETLNQLYGHSRSYLHGHSVGGTNPSLLRALGCGAPVTAFDVVFNREVTAGNANFFSNPDDLAGHLDRDERHPSIAVQRGEAGRTHAAQHYRWDDVAHKYEAMLTAVAKSGLGHRRLGWQGLSTRRWGGTRNIRRTRPRHF